MHWTDLTLNLLYSAIGTLVICLAGSVLALLLWRVLRIKADRNHAMVLENKGNCQSLYYLEVKSPEPALRFSLLYNGLPLAAVYLPVESDDPADVQDNQKTSGQVDSTRNSSVPAVAAGVDSATKTSQAASAKTGMFASLLEQIGEILPGELGSKLKQQSSTVRRVQVKANRVARAPQKIRRKVSGFHQLNSGKKGSKPGQLSPSGQKLDAMPGRSNSAKPEETYFVQTPVIGPGQSLNLSLKIGSRGRRYLQGTFPYSIEALPMSADFPEVEPRPYTQNGSVHFNRVESWRYFLPVVTYIAIFLIAAAGIVFLYRFIWL